MTRILYHIPELEFKNIGRGPDDTYLIARCGLMNYRIYALNLYWTVDVEYLEPQVVYRLDKVLALAEAKQLCDKHWENFLKGVLEEVKLPPQSPEVPDQDENS
jgi:hypothetical protein